MTYDDITARTNRQPHTATPPLQDGASLTALSTELTAHRLHAGRPPDTRGGTRAAGSVGAPTGARLRDRDETVMGPEQRKAHTARRIHHMDPRESKRHTCTRRRSVSPVVAGLYGLYGLYGL